MQDGTTYVHTLSNDARRLVAEDHGLLDDEVADAAVDEVVDIRTTDTGLLHGDEDLIAADCSQKSLEIEHKFHVFQA